MSEHAMIFAAIAIGCGFIGIACAIIISVEEDIAERTYGNGKESGFKDQPE